MTGYIMYLAPIATLAAIAAITAIKGPELLITYGKFILSFYLASSVSGSSCCSSPSFFIGRRVIDLAMT